MRPELNEIQYIEEYLQGKLAGPKKLEFEKSMLDNPEFKQKVELQQQLMQGIENRALRNSIAKAYSKFKFSKKLKWGLGGAGILIAIVGAMFAYQILSSGGEHVLLN